MSSVKNIYFKIRNIFVYSFAHSRLRQLIGFKNISYLTQTQGWFLWIDGKDGVYDLFTLPGEDDNSINFLIKYYPALEEEAFKHLSEREQEIRTTFTFKEGAPLWEDRENEMADHFVAGRLDILWEDAAIWVNLSVPDDGRTTAQKAQLSHDLYKRMLRALCIFNRTVPSIVLTKIVSVESIQADHFLTILLPGEGDKANRITEICELLQVNTGASAIDEDGAWQPVYVEDFRDGSTGDSPLLDESWWTLSEQSEEVVPRELHI